MTNYNWTPALLTDVENMADLSIEHYLNDSLDIFNLHIPTALKSLSLAVVNQYFSPLTELISVCKNNNNKLLAYTYCIHSTVQYWSLDNIVEVRMATVDLSLPTKLKIKLLNDMFKLWENFALLSNSNIILSNTMRKDQDSFLKLHQKNGYIVRGSYAYKKLNTTQATPAN